MRVLLLACCVTPLATIANAADYALTLGAEFSSGDFGLPENTDVLISSAEASSTVEDWRYSASLAYVRISGPTVLIAPTPVETLQNRRPIPNPPGVAAELRTDGIADLLLSTSRTIRFPKENALLDVSVSVKVPTGDADRFLSTGQTDVGLRADFIKRIGEFSFGLGAGYIVSGKTDRFDVQNRAQISISAFHSISDTIGLGVAAEWREPILTGLDDITEISFYASAPVSHQTSVVGYVLTGVTQTSPNIGGGIRITRSF
ncbi:MAG: hypothetical protein AAF668_01295 [Pseudomonadota bacterium]